MVKTTLEMERIGSAAERELAAFLHAVEQVFGAGEIRRASDFWLAALERIGPVHDRPEEVFRDVTIQATTQLTYMQKVRSVNGRN
jgi:hypothetical protein